MTDATYGPRSQHNARLLLDAAEELGYPSRVVRTSRGGYLVPQDVLDLALGVDKIEEGVFYPAPEENVSEGQEGAPKEDDKPRGNASREAWADYAKPRGIEVTDNMSRDDIKNLVNEEE